MSDHPVSPLPRTVVELLDRPSHVAHKTHTVRIDGNEVSLSRPEIAVSAGVGHATIMTLTLPAETVEVSETGKVTIDGVEVLVAKDGFWLSWDRTEVQLQLLANDIRFIHDPKES